MATVLVVDDEVPIRDNLTRFLRLEGHSVLTAADGRAALALLQAHLPALPHLILSDVMMPHMDGIELLAQVQADERWRTIPFVFLSASAEPEKLQDALSRGAQGYITKPFNLASLHQMLALHLPPQDPGASA